MRVNEWEITLSALGTQIPFAEKWGFKDSIVVGDHPAAEDLANTNFSRFNSHIMTLPPGTPFQVNIHFHGNTIHDKIGFKDPAMEKTGQPVWYAFSVSVGETFVARAFNCDQGQWPLSMNIGMDGTHIMFPPFDPKDYFPLPSTEYIWKGRINVSMSRCTFTGNPSTENVKTTMPDRVFSFIPTPDDIQVPGQQNPTPFQRIRSIAATDSLDRLATFFRGLCLNYDPELNRSYNTLYDKMDTASTVHSRVAECTPLPSGNVGQAPVIAFSLPQATPLQLTPHHIAPQQVTSQQIAPIQITPLQATPLLVNPLQLTQLHVTPLQPAPLQVEMDVDVPSPAAAQPVNTQHIAAQPMVAPIAGLLVCGTQPPADNDTLMMDAGPATIAIIPVANQTEDQTCAQTLMEQVAEGRKRLDTMVERSAEVVEKQVQGGIAMLEGVLNERMNERMDERVEEKTKVLEEFMQEKTGALEGLVQEKTEDLQVQMHKDAMAISGVLEEVMHMKLGGQLMERAIVLNQAMNKTMDEKVDDRLKQAEVKLGHAMQVQSMALEESLKERWAAVEKKAREELSQGWLEIQQSRLKIQQARLEIEREKEELAQKTAMVDNLTAVSKKIFDGGVVNLRKAIIDEIKADTTITSEILNPTNLVKNLIPIIKDGTGAGSAVIMVELDSNAARAANIEIDVNEEFYMPDSAETVSVDMDRASTTAESSQGATLYGAPDASPSPIDKQAPEFFRLSEKAPETATPVPSHLVAAIEKAENSWNALPLEPEESEVPYSTELVEEDWIKDLTEPPSNTTQCAFGNNLPAVQPTFRPKNLEVYQHNPFIVNPFAQQNSTEGEASKQQAPPTRRGASTSTKPTYDPYPRTHRDDRLHPESLEADSTLFPPETSQTLEHRRVEHLKSEARRYPTIDSIGFRFEAENGTVTFPTWTREEEAVIKAAVLDRKRKEWVREFGEPGKEGLEGRGEELLVDL